MAQMSMRGGRIFLFLFGLPFLLTGIWACYSVASNIYDWQRMKNWQPVQAKIISGGVKESSGSEGGSTYAAEATYQYDYMGMPHTGTRTAISGGSDNIGSFNEDLGRRIENAQGRTMEVYVNPDNPDEAVINRDIRWSMVGFKSVFLFAFGGVGLAMVLGSILARGPNDASLPQYRDAPWLANNDWQTPEIKSGSKAAMFFAWGFCFLWNCISMPLPFLLVEEVTKKENYAALLGLLFPLVGVGLIVWAVRQTLEWKRFGAAPVTLDPFPGSIGGHVGGTLELPYPFDPAVKYVFTLSSIYSYVSRSGKNSDRRETVKWQETAVGYAETGLYGTRLSFRFDVPEGLTPSDAVHLGREYHLWRLNLTADMPGVDVDRDYEIPVYPTKHKSLRIDGRAVQHSASATQELEQTGAKKRVQLRPGMMGDELFYPMGRNIGGAVIGTIVGLCFAGVGAVVALIKDGSYIFGGIFLLIGVPITLGSFYIAVNSLTVRRDGQGGIETIRRVFGIPVKRGYIAADAITKLDWDSHTGVTKGNKQIKFYDIFVPLEGKKRLVLGEGFQGTGEAEAGAKLIRETLGLRS